jgi:hypothetical protein
MGTKTLSGLAAIAVAIIAMAIVEPATATKESCEYDVNNVTDPYGGKTLLLTKSHFLQTPVDINASHASLSAARLRSQDPPAAKRYLRVDFILVEFVETEEDAESRRGLTKITKGLPLVIELGDGSTMTLTSWSNDGRRDNSRIDGPSELGNSSTLFRVIHFAGGSYWLDADQLAVLLEQPAILMQVTTTQGDFSVNIHPSRTDRIQYVLGCVVG